MRSTSLEATTVDRNTETIEWSVRVHIFRNRIIVRRWLSLGIPFGILLSLCSSPPTARALYALAWWAGSSS
jgi:hypothetical protein